MTRLALIVAALLLAGASGGRVVRYALPDETPVALPAGPGAEATANNCAACHSLDYITTQPPKMGAKFWDAEVTKMVEKYGAPVQPGDAKAISAYLGRTFG